MTNEVLNWRRYLGAQKLIDILDYSGRAAPVKIIKTVKARSLEIEVDHHDPSSLCCKIRSHIAQLANEGLGVNLGESWIAPLEHEGVEWPRPVIVCDRTTARPSDLEIRSYLCGDALQEFNALLQKSSPCVNEALFSQVKDMPFLKGIACEYLSGSGTEFFEVLKSDLFVAVVNHTTQGFFKAQFHRLQDLENALTELDEMARERSASCEVRPLEQSMLRV